MGHRPRGLQRNGNAWSTSPTTRPARAYKWGEDGIAGFCDDAQILCFSIALWNGVDPILKERMFGLTNAEGNHGEDVKEYYFYLDATPTSSYLKYRYRYPLGGYPYDDIVATNHNRSRNELEYELVNTGVFDNDHYLDVDVEYAKNKPEDIAVRVTPHQPRLGVGDGARASPPVVPQRVVARGGEGDGERGCAGHDRRRAPVVRDAGALVRRHSDAPLHRERDRTTSACSDRLTPLPT